MRLHRPIEGDIKTVTIKRQAGQWFAMFSCDNVPVRSYPAATKAVGIDLGLETLIATSDGERLEDTRAFAQAEAKLRRLQRHLARQEKGSQRRKETVRQIQRLHQHIANQRSDAAHKATSKLVEENGLIAYEALSPQFMLKNRHLSKRAADAAWGKTVTFLQAKAAAAGRPLVPVDAKNTSQICSGCGERVEKDLAQRKHKCPHCGLELHRDHNAAINILKRATSSQ